MYYLALAMYSPSRLVQTQGLTLIKVISPFTGQAAEHLLVKALEDLPCKAMCVIAQDESSDSTMTWHEGSYMLDESSDSTNSLA